MDKKKLYIICNVNRYIKCNFSHHPQKKIPPILNNLSLFPISINMLLFFFLLTDLDSFWPFQFLQMFVLVDSYVGCLLWCVWKMTEFQGWKELVGVDQRPPQWLMLAKHSKWGHLPRRSRPRHWRWTDVVVWWRYLHYYIVLTTIPNLLVTGSWEHNSLVNIVKNNDNSQTW